MLTGVGSKEFVHCIQKKLCLLFGLYHFTGIAATNFRQSLAETGRSHSFLPEGFTHDLKAKCLSVFIVERTGHARLGSAKKTGATSRHFFIGEENSCHGEAH